VYYVNKCVKKMPNLTLSVPERLKQDMSEFKVINWSEVAREAFEKKIAQLKILEEFAKESELTKEDALRIGRKINNSISKRAKRCK